MLILLENISSNLAFAEFARQKLFRTSSHFVRLVEIFVLKFSLANSAEAHGRALATLPMFDPVEKGHSLIFIHKTVLWISPAVSGTAVRQPDVCERFFHRTVGKKLSFHLQR